MVVSELTVVGDRQGSGRYFEKNANTIFYLEMRRALVLKIIELMIAESEVSARALVRELEDLVNNQIQNEIISYK